MPKVVVKVFNEEGKWLLNEIRGLKEGAIVEGKWDRNNHGFDFKWNGGDAVLWKNVNCRPYIPKRRLEKGYILDTCCWAVTFNKHCLGTGETRSDCIAYMTENGYDRSDYNIMWVARDYNPTKDVYGFVEGTGDTKAEAISNFYENYF